jgi:hypothetical protein
MDDQDKAKVRLTLEGLHGKVWTTDEMTAEFEVEGFCAGYCVVRRKSDGQRGSLDFQHMPRFYFNFIEHK